jgi:hypothetical protein
MPPPSSAARLPVTVVAFRIRSPPFWMPAPTRLVAVLPRTVEAVTVTVVPSPTSMPPSPPPVTTSLERVTVTLVSRSGTTVRTRPLPRPSRVVGALACGLPNTRRSLPMT